MYDHQGQEKSKYSQIQIEGLAQERRNSSALAMELCLSCTNPWINISYIDMLCIIYVNA